MKIIAGPCQHESLDHSLKIAEYCFNVCKKHEIDYYFKASYDKANRTHINGKRGQGIFKTMHDFKMLKESLQGLQILTDVHKESDIDLIEDQFFDCVDVYQIPAFLCRQTDLIRRACETNKIVNIKKGQFLAPWDVKGILSKTKDIKTDNQIWLTERGTSFGYNTLVVDFTGLDYMLENLPCEVFFDATHSVQQPGGKGESSGGNRKFVPGLTRAASALGVQNYFMEVHDDPDNAPSDGANMLHINIFDKVVENIVKYNFIRNNAS